MPRNAQSHGARQSPAGPKPVRQKEHRSRSPAARLRSGSLARKSSWTAMPRTLAATLSMLKLLTNTQEFVEQFWIILLELIANCFPAGRCRDVISLDHGLL